MTEPTTLLIDVRTAEEYDKRHISGAFHLPIMDIAGGHLGVLADVDKHARVELYCRSGARSEQAKEHLLRMGFENVVNLGGLDDIVQKREPEVKKSSLILFLKKLWNR